MIEHVKNFLVGLPFTAAIFGALLLAVCYPETLTWFFASCGVAVIAGATWGLGRSIRLERKPRPTPEAKEGKWTR